MQIHIIILVLHYETTKFEEALDAFNKSLSIKPTSAEAYKNLGNTQKKLDRSYEAEESYKKAIALKLTMQVQA